jgi:hypothetical protein
VSVSRKLVIARLTRVLEAFHDGEDALAIAIVEDLRRDLVDGCQPRPYRCALCDCAFRWPSLLDHHLRFVHASGEQAS